ncbi:hypothetical protein RhiLY_10994 [Ceratobasidium sp. AG-Ba]|nr:hypothetical protein RhiLY_10994 [Ceratobasidium sp. AG-Ba]
MPLITSYFSRATAEEAAEQATRGFEEIRHSIEWEKAQKLSEDGLRAQRLREQATERQRRRRKRLKESEIKLGLRESGTLRKLKPMQLRNPSPDPPTPSHSETHIYPDTNKPKKRRAPRTNWYGPVYWTAVCGVVKNVGFSSPQTIVHNLHVGLRQIRRRSQALKSELGDP